MEICKNHIASLAILGAYSLLEYYLGKTHKTRAASLIELVFLVFTSIVAILIIKFKPKPKE